MEDYENAIKKIEREIEKAIEESNEKFENASIRSDEKFQKAIKKCDETFDKVNSRFIYAVCFATASDWGCGTAPIALYLADSGFWRSPLLSFSMGNRNDKSIPSKNPPRALVSYNLNHGLGGM